MKIKYIGWVLLGLLILFAAVSCKSSPAAEEPPPVRDNRDEAVLNSLDDAENRALTARKLVSDFNGQSFFPIDWRGADALLTEADREKSTTSIEAMKASTERYSKAADAFEGMIDKTLLRYYEVKEEELITARNAAVAADAEEICPEYLLEADDVVGVAVKKYEGKDYYGAKDTANEALSMYDVMGSWLVAYNVRMEIADRDFEIYDPQNIEIADDTLRSAVVDYSAKDYSAAKDKSESALLRYNLAAKTAWESYAADKGAEAADERQAALDIKANVAVRQEFNAAQDVYNRANTAFRAERFEEAAKGFEDSIGRYEGIIQTTLNKRAEAEEALVKANQRMAESDTAARNAELILEGGVE